MSMTTIDRKKHAFKRRINVRALTDSSMKKLEPSMIRSIRLLCQQLIDSEVPKDSWSSSKDMTKLVSYAMSDIMGEMVFSKNWNVLQSSENRDMLEFLPQGVACVNITGHMPGLLNFGLYKLVAHWRVANNNQLKGDDLFASLMNAIDTETGLGLTPEEIVSEAGLLIIAGSDTMGTSVVSTMFYLLHNPSCLSQVQKEVRASFNEVDDIHMGDRLASCHYLFACITEAMRFTPPVGACLPREVLKGGINVDGVWYPEGIDLSVPIYGLHHNEDYFPDSFTYLPERWIVDYEGTRTREAGITEADVARATSAYHPFGVGRASCVGRHLAYQEMSIMLARIIWLFDMRLEPGSKVGGGNENLGGFRDRRYEFQTWDKFVSTHEGPIVRFTI